MQYRRHRIAVAFADDLPAPMSFKMRRCQHSHLLWVLVQVPTAPLMNFCFYQHQVSSYREHLALMPLQVPPSIHFQTELFAAIIKRMINVNLIIPFSKKY